MNDAQQTSMKQALEMMGFEELGLFEPSMTNLDNSIPDGLEERLRNNHVIAGHAASNFYGYVWFNGKDFSEEIWRFRKPVKVIRADTLRELMDKANEEFGAE